MNLKKWNTFFLLLICLYNPLSFATPPHQTEYIEITAYFDHRMPTGSFWLYYEDNELLSVVGVYGVHPTQQMWTVESSRLTCDDFNITQNHLTVSIGEDRVNNVVGYDCRPHPHRT